MKEDTVLSEPHWFMSNFRLFFITLFGVESQRLSIFYGVCQRLSNSWVELFRIPIWCEVERRNLHLDGSSYLQLLPWFKVIHGQAPPSPFVIFGSGRIKTLNYFQNGKQVREEQWQLWFLLLLKVFHKTRSACRFPMTRFRIPYRQKVIRSVIKSDNISCGLIANDIVSKPVSNIWKEKKSCCSIARKNVPINVMNFKWTFLLNTVCSLQDCLWWIE